MVTKLRHLFFVILIATILFLVYKVTSVENSLNNFVTDTSEQHTLSKEKKYEQLNKLLVDAQIEYFSELIGNPIFVNFQENQLKEYVFVDKDKDYIVQAATDQNNKVLTYSVLSNSKDFNPTFSKEGLYSVTLNKTPFSEWITDRDTPMSCYEYITAHDPLLYFEERYWGNPSDYQTILVGSSNAALEFNLPRINQDQLSYGRVDCGLVSKEDRGRMTPNTFIVKGTMLPSLPEERKPGVFFGPNSVQMRPFRKTN